MTSGPYSSDTAPLAQTDVLVLDYLAALWAASEELEPDLRDELMTTVADYIALRRSVGQGDDPMQVLRLLGAPESLVGAARRGRMPAHLRRPATMTAAPAAAAPAPSAAGEYTGLALLAGGSVLMPVVAPLAGMLLISGSPRWSPAQKTAAWVLAAGPALLGFAIFVLGVMFSGGMEGIVIAYLLSIAGAFVAAMSLLPGLTARRTYSQG
ncbi:hypothetical protein [Actinoplanes sp. NPDC051859]|uniref:hypothetical protein n=1 Tax=Actinoplanes sp. NPDC051859 TaxID=3363909 RepID=UPI0037989CDB